VERDVSRLRPGRFYTRRDANEPAIVEALRAQGFVVDHINGKGVPDLLVSKGGAMWLVEVKTPKGGFKPAQEEWRERFRGPAPITLRTVDDALRFQLMACESPERTRDQ
jgi:Holliday junction resolvase